MLWSLLKILLFVAAVGAATYGAFMLMDVSGGALVEIAGYEVALSPLEMVIVLLVLGVVIWLLFKLVGLLIAGVHFLNGDETALTRYFSRSRERRGLNALSDSMLALAAGDGRRAMTRAARAERYLGRPEMTRLLTAQAAELSGDRKRAEDSYKALLEDPRTRFVGIRGVMKQKLAAGDTDTALKLAEKAFALRPAHDEVSTTLLRLQAEREDWQGARKTLGAKLRHGGLPRDVHRRRDAVLALSEAREMVAQNKAAEAHHFAMEANRLSPDLVPAAVMAARAQIAAGNQRGATRILRRAWEVRPHPDLAAAFAEIAPDEKPAARIKRFRTLTGIHINHPETRMLLAELHIADEDFPAARRALGDLADAGPTARVLTLMAAIERGEGASDTIVRGWLTRALTASRGPQWICDNCHHINAEWAPVCPNCKSFDSFAWTTSTDSEVAMPKGTQMLPLIVGQDPAAADPATETELPETDAIVMSQEPDGTPPPPPDMPPADRK